MIDTIRIRFYCQYLIDAFNRLNGGTLDSSVCRCLVSPNEVLSGLVASGGSISISELSQRAAISELRRLGIDIASCENLQLQNIGSWQRSVFLQYEHVRNSIILEFSLPKLIQGHNVFHPAQDVRDMLETSLRLIYAAMGVAPYEIELSASKWFDDYQMRDERGNYNTDYVLRGRYTEILRLDLATLYHVDDMTGFLEMFRMQRHKRKRVQHYVGSVMLIGSQWTQKFYDKHAEFLAHDFNKLKKIAPELAHDLYSQSKNVMRGELTLRKKQLPKIGICTLFDVVNADLISIYNNYLEKLDLTEVASMDSRDLLHTIGMPKTESDRKLLEFSMMLKNLGIDTVKNIYPERTFYRYMSALKNRGLTQFDLVASSDISIDLRANSDFSPSIIRLYSRSA